MNKRTPLTIAAVLGAAAAITLPAAAFAGPEHDSHTTTATAAHPSVDEILDRFIEAQGGRKLIESRKFIHMTGKFEVLAMGMVGTIDITMAPKGRFIQIVEIPNVGTITNGCDGETVWTINPFQGPAIVTGIEAEQAKKQTNFQGDLNLREDHASIEFVGQTTFKDIECFELAFVDHEGEKSTRFYDMKTGQERGSRSMLMGHQGPTESTEFKTEFKTFDGQTIATITESESQGTTRVMSIDNITFDKPDNDIFALPKEIRAMVED